MTRAAAASSVAALDCADESARGSAGAAAWRPAAGGQDPFTGRGPERASEVDNKMVLMCQVLVSSHELSEAVV